MFSQLTSNFINRYYEDIDVWKNFVIDFLEHYKISQRQLAEFACINHSTLSLILRNKSLPTFETMIAISSAIDELRTNLRCIHEFK